MLHPWSSLAQSWRKALQKVPPAQVKESVAQENDTFNRPCLLSYSRYLYPLRLIPHQGIQLIPPTDKQASIDAERGENWHVVGLKDDFLYKARVSISTFLVKMQHISIWCNSFQLTVQQYENCINWKKLSCCNKTSFLPCHILLVFVFLLNKESLGQIWEESLFVIHFLSTISDHSEWFFTPLPQVKGF